MVDQKQSKRKQAESTEPAAKKQRAESDFKYADTKAMERASSCWLPTEFVDLPLVNIISVNHDTNIFEFGLPEGESLCLPVCACLLMKTTAANGEVIVRPYTPVSDNSMTGKFQLLVKRYEQGKMSRFVHELALGGVASFKHIAL